MCNLFIKNIIKSNQKDTNIENGFNYTTTQDNVRAAARRVTQQQGMGMMGQPTNMRIQQVGQMGPRGPVPGMPPHMQDQQQMQQQQGVQGMQGMQGMMEENLSDKEMYPGQNMGMHGPQQQQHGQMVSFDFLYCGFFLCISFENKQRYYV